ncbi:MAG: hypothetical protein A2X47_01855 [Lentisphaerae bacterium GWF2_38_69]|nr:MAG: hypothetical protein A2X47_01855 [Lentisphaerae bacterium GWF2_38_69]
MFAKISKKTIFCAAIGTTLEWYDFTVFIYIAPLLSKLFFPSEDKLVSIISTFGVFTAGYLMRPLGGIILGNLGDKIGRKKVLILSVWLMAVPMVIITFLPTYDTIGIYAVLILTLARMLQGFSVGGEYTGVLVMLLEQAQPENRGFIASWGTCVSGSGVLLSSLVVALTTGFLGDQTMLQLGWRIPFAIGILIAAFSLVMQFQMKESPHFEKIKKEGKISKRPAWDALKKYPGKIFIVFCLTGYLGIAYYMVAAFLPTYLTLVLHYPHEESLILTTVIAALYAFSAPLWGKLSDKVGRKPLMLGGTLFFIFFGYPVFKMFASGNIVYAYIAALLLMTAVTAFTAAFVSSVNELFPTNERFSGMSIGYNIGNAALGGTAPLVSTLLISLTGNAVAPCYYLIIGGILILFVIGSMKETAGKPLAEY